MSRTRYALVALPDDHDGDPEFVTDLDGGTIVATGLGTVEVAVAYEVSDDDGSSTPVSWLASIALQVADYPSAALLAAARLTRGPS